MDRPPQHADSEARPGVGSSALVAVLVAVAYTILAPDFLWGGDSVAFLRAIHEGETNRAAHFLYLPVVRVLAEMGALFGLDAFQCLRGASILGTAAGIGLMHRAALLLGASRGRAASIALMLATTPAVAFFGMIVEIPGVLMGASGLVFLAVACFLRGPTLWSAAVVGLATGGASCLHSSAHLMPLTVSVFCLARGARPDRRWARFAVLCGLAHVSVIAVVALATDLPVVQSLRSSGSFVDTALQLGSPLGTTKSFLFHEWIIPYAPLSLVIFNALRHRGQRMELAGLAFLAALYTAITWPLLAATWSTQLVEHGGYYITLAFPLAWLASSQYGASAGKWLWTGGAIMSAVMIWGESIKITSELDADEVALALGTESATVLTHSSEGLLDLCRRLPAMEAHRLDQVTGVTARRDAIFRALDSLYLETKDRGEKLVLTATLRRELAEAAIPIGWYMEHNFDFEVVSTGSFLGYVLVSRAQ